MKCLYCLRYHIRNPQKKYIESGPFAVCNDHLLPCAKVTAHGKDLAFAVCNDLGTRQRFSLCRVPGRGSTRQSPSPHHPAGRAQNFAVGQIRHTVKVLPCVRNIAHGKGCLCRRLFAGWPLTCAAHDKAFAVCFSGFAVCFGHTANRASPVVAVG